MRFAILFICLLPLLIKGEDSLPLSKDAKLSLVTCGQGESLESAFGHSALRMVDSAYGIDVVFNYGSFNYSYAEFYYRFLKGDPVFYLTIVPTPSFLQDYRQQNRGVIENAINLDSATRHEIFKFLMWNAQEDNYAYSYDFFTNNCATKIRDILESHGFPLQAAHGTTTYRELVMEQLRNHASYRILLGMVFGTETDAPIGADKAAFLPEKLHALLSKTGNDKGKLLGPTSVLLQGEPRVPGIDNPLFAGTLLLLTMLSSLLWAKPRLHAALASAALLISGLLGILYLVLWTLSENPYMHENFNLIWALPINVVAAWLVYSRPAIGRFYVKYYGYYLLCAPLVLLGVPQGFYCGIYAWVPLLGTYLIFASRRFSGEAKQPTLFTKKTVPDAKRAGN